MNLRGRIPLARLGIVALLLIGLTVGTLPSVGAVVAVTTYYVRTDGSDTLCNGATNAAAIAAPNCAFQTIGKAVSVASSGDTIQVGGGTFAEQVSVTTSLILTGAGADSTTIKAPATLVNDPFGNKALVEFNGKLTASMSGFTVSGPGSSGCGSIDDGIVITAAASVALNAMTVTSIRDNPLSGCQNGEGIRIGTTHNGPASTGTISATKIIVSDFQKNGITFSGAGTQGTIDQSTVTGAGATPSIAQNGIQVGNSATATLTNNTISGMECNNAACSADPITGVQSAAILLYDPTGGAVIQNNHVSNSDIGIYNYVTANSTTGPTATKVGSGTPHIASPFDQRVATTGPSKTVVANTSPTQITGNTLSGNRYEGIFLDQGNATLSGNTITGGNIGVEAASFSGETGNAFGALTNMNRINSATVAGIQIQLDPSAGTTNRAGVIGSTNDISGNVVGVNNTTTNTVTLTNNWWGSASGPKHAPTNTSGTGDAVSDHVTFNPWCVNSACTFGGGGGGGGGGGTVIPPAGSTGTTGASSNTVVFGQNTVTITWDTGDGSLGEVRVSVNGGPESIFAQGASGSKTADFINSGSYVFTLYIIPPATTSKAAAADPYTQRVSSTTVHKLTPNGTTDASALTNPASVSFAVSTNQLTRSSTISFDTGDGSVGQLMLSVNGGAEQLFAAAQYGTVSVPWIFSGTYTFRFIKGGGTVSQAQVATTAQISSPNGTTSGGPSPNVTTSNGTAVLLTFDTGNGQPAALCTNFGGLVSFSANGAGFASVNNSGTVIYDLHIGSCTGPKAVPGTVTITSS